MEVRGHRHLEKQEAGFQYFAHTYLTDRAHDFLSGLTVGDIVIAVLSRVVLSFLKRRKT